MRLPPRRQPLHDPPHLIDAALLITPVLHPSSLPRWAAGLFRGPCRRAGGRGRGALFHKGFGSRTEKFGEGDDLFNIRRADIILPILNGAFANRDAEIVQLQHEFSTRPPFIFAQLQEHFMIKLSHASSVFSKVYRTAKKLSSIIYYLTIATSWRIIFLCFLPSTLINAKRFDVGRTLAHSLFYMNLV